MTDADTGPDAWASTITECLAREGARMTPSIGPASPEKDSVRYTMLGVLGEGGMGRVLSARDAQFGRTVALKEMTLGPERPEFIRRFLLESLVTANLEHPGVVPVYERGVRDGAPFYVMRKVQGRPLSEVIRSASTLPERLALVPAVIRAAHALGFAHERGVVHRDIKPDNIMLGAHGETVILDWGIAKVRGLMEDQADDSPLANLAASGGETVAGAVLGTPSYMAPEQAQGRVDQIDARTDVFALGAVLYEVLTGRPPYRESTAMLTLSAAGMVRFEPIDRAAPEVPTALRAVVRTALSADPAQRYPHASAMAKALEDVQASAWLGEDSLAARTFARAMAALGLLMTVLGAAGVWRVLPSLREMGVGAYFCLLSALSALALAALEWRTRGRYRAMSLAVALNLSCALGGVAAATSGMGMAFRILSGEHALSNERLWRELLSIGLFEAVGNISASFTLAAFVAVVLAIVYQRNVRLEKAER